MGYIVWMYRQGFFGVLGATLPATHSLIPQVQYITSTLQDRFLV
jgi:hypothetical protein